MRLATLQAGQTVSWGGYYTNGDAGGNYGIVKAGAHTDDGGSVFSLVNGNYVEANLKGKRLNVRKFGANFDTANNAPFINAAMAFLHDGTELYFPQGDTAGDEYAITETITNKQPANRLGR